MFCSLTVYRSVQTWCRTMFRSTVQPEHEAQLKSPTLEHHRWRLVASPQPMSEELHYDARNDLVTFRTNELPRLIGQNNTDQVQTRFRPGSDQVQTSFRSVSDQVQTSCRLCSGQFQIHLRPGSHQFHISFRPVSDQVHLIVNLKHNFERAHKSPSRTL